MVGGGDEEERTDAWRREGGKGGEREKKLSNGSGEPLILHIMIFLSPSLLPPSPLFFLLTFSFMRVFNTNVEKSLRVMNKFRRGAFVSLLFFGLFKFFSIFFV